MRSSYQVGVVQSSSTYEAFRRSQYETYQTIWHRIKAADNVMKSSGEAREREEFVFIADGPGLRHVTNQPPCDRTAGKWYRTILSSCYSFWNFSLCPFDLSRSFIIHGHLPWVWSKVCISPQFLQAPISKFSGLTSVLHSRTCWQKVISRTLSKRKWWDTGWMSWGTRNGQEAIIFESSDWRGI